MDELLSSQTDNQVSKDVPSDVASACWAHQLGSCSDKISREHIVSRAHFSQDRILVQGFPWCKLEPKEISLDSLTVRRLCTHHNNLLGRLGVDAEVGNYMAAAREAKEVVDNVSRRFAIPSRVERFTVNAALLERWLLKTLINLTVDSPYLVGGDAPALGIPSKKFVEIAFGFSGFEGHAGMYVAAHAKQQLRFDERLSFSTIKRDEKCVVGGLFEMRGCRFVLWLEADAPPVSFQHIPNSPQDWQAAEMKPRFESIFAKAGPYTAAALKFDWAQRVHAWPE